VTQPLPPNFFPTIDKDKVPEEVQVHLRLIYDRLLNHSTAVTNLQNQINALKTGKS
jgi:hypothetical protein